MEHRNLFNEAHTLTYKNQISAPRSSNEIFDDLLALEQPGDDPTATFRVIAAQLRWSPDRARRRYLTICDELGVPADED